MGTRTSHQPAPVFDPAIPADHQQTLNAVRHRLRSPDSARPPKKTRWRQKPVDTMAMLVAFLIIGLIGWTFATIIVGGILGDAAGGFAALVLLPFGLGIPIWHTGRVAGEQRGDKVLRIHHGRYLRPEEFDAESGRLLARAQRATHTVLKSAVHKQGLIDSRGNAVVLPQYVWDLAQILHAQTDLRAEQHAAKEGVMTEELHAVLMPQQQALRRSVATVTGRVERLEEYAHRVQVAESAYKARTLMNSNDKYRDLLARTDDQEALAHLRTGVDDAESALRASLQAAIAAGETLAVR